MAEAFRLELAEIRGLIKTAALPDEVSHTVAWCLEQLPALYHKFCRSHESKYAEEILRLEQGVVGKLVETHPLSPDGQPLQDAVLHRLRLFNEQFGLPRPNFKRLGASTTSFTKGRVA